MDLAGLADAFIELGYPSPGLDIGLGGAGHRVSVEMRTLDSRYPFMLVLPQQQTEQILADALKSHGVETEWRSTVIGVEQSSEDVVVTVEREDSTSERIRARYAIGCDGAHSSVRQLVNLPFEGPIGSPISSAPSTASSCWHAPTATLPDIGLVSIRR